MKNLTPEQLQALTDYLHNIEVNDGLHVDYVMPEQVVSLIEALNALDGGSRDPADYAEDV